MMHGRLVMLVPRLVPLSIQSRDEALANAKAMSCTQCWDGIVFSEGTTGLARIEVRRSNGQHYVQCLSGQLVVR